MATHLRGLSTRALAYRGAVDFDDLIRLALTLLESDDEFRERLQYRYPFILEDEAQDPGSDAGKNFKFVIWRTVPLSRFWERGWG
ncbi:MAG: UvrD-helicase domain-containing protein [Anaerolineales bacterium]|nr:UvrD-helicase domain-containing protein [Anaerolineales bacterium]